MRDDNSIREKLSRRRYAQILAAGGIAGLAGCPGGTETDTPGSGGDGDGDGDTPTATPEDTGDGGSTATETDTPEQEETVPPGEPNTDTVRVFIENTPDEFDWNPYTPQDNTPGTIFMSDLVALGQVNTTDWKGGGTFEVPHHYGRDEIEIMTWVEDYEVEVPYDHWNYHDDRATYWNGEPYDAEARYLMDKVRHFADGNKYQEGAIHRSEAVDQWTYHWWRSKGEVPGAEADPVNRTVLEGDAKITYGWPLPPEWSEPWIQKFEATGTQEAYEEQIAALRGDRVSLERVAENGWGSGPYELRGPEDIASDRVVLHLRDEDSENPHPNAEHINIPMLQMQMGNQDRRLTLFGNGAVDLGGGSVTPNNQVNPELLPDHMKETVRYLQSGGGDSLWWNMNNPHLESLWVRRALVTAIDFEVAGTNGWGEQRSIPLDQFSGLLDTTAGSTFSDEFLDSLHTWEITADTETATEYMQNAGYEQQGGVWTAPDGSEFTVDIQIPGIGDWVGAAQTIRQQLREFGVNCTFSQHDWSTWSNNLDTFANENAPNFDMSIHWYGHTDPFGHYKSQAAWWDNGSILGGDPNGEGGDRRSVDADDEYTILNQPVQAPIPTEPGDISAPTGADAYPNNPPDLEGVTDYEMVNMAELMDGLREPQDSEEALQEKFRTCARYYNYYLPKFAFHQYTFGAWGNVRDLDWPPENHESLFWESTFDIKDTMALGGVIQASYDDELDR